MTRLTRAALVFIVVFGGAQLVRPNYTNPPIDPSRTILAQVGMSKEFVAVLDRSCRDCHSNATEWRWYSQVAPLSWLMASGVEKGREAVNFSEWATYPSDQRRMLLGLSCQAASDGRMPGLYTLIRPDTRLSKDDIRTICAAASRVGAPISGEEWP